MTYVYVVDVLGDIYYLDRGLGTATHSITNDVQVYPGGVLWYGPGFPYTPSASSLSVSTCAGGPYPPCNMLFVAGSNGGSGDIVCAYPSLPNADNPPPYWCQYFTFSAPNTVITSSPVVSDSLGRVYVQDSGELYALDQNPVSPPGGNIVWSMPLVPSGSGHLYIVPTPVGGSPAYDDVPEYAAPLTKYVIASASFNSYSNDGGHTQFLGSSSILSVYDATSGALVCSANIGHPVTNSSPEVVNGIIYIGTDDGYVLAYQEPPYCNNGTLTPLWTSSPMDSGLEGPPVVSFNRVHAVSQRGTLYIWHLLHY